MNHEGVVDVVEEVAVGCNVMLKRLLPLSIDAKAICPSSRRLVFIFPALLSSPSLVGVRTILLEYLISVKRWMLLLLLWLLLLLFVLILHSSLLLLLLMLLLMFPIPLPLRFKFIVLLLLLLL